MLRDHQSVCKMQMAVLYLTLMMMMRMVILMVATTLMTVMPRPPTKAIMLGFIGDDDEANDKKLQP